MAQNLRPPGRNLPISLLCLFSRRTGAENSTFFRVDALITATESFHLFSLLFFFFVTFRGAARCTLTRLFQTVESVTVPVNLDLSLAPGPGPVLSLFICNCGQSRWRKRDRERIRAAFRQRGGAHRRGVECLLSQGFIQFSCPSRKTRRSVLHLERKTNKNLSSDLWSPARCPDRGGKTQDVQIHSGHCEKASVAELFLSQPTRKDIYSV